MMVAFRNKLLILAILVASVIAIVSGMLLTQTPFVNAIADNFSNIDNKANFDNTIDNVSSVSAPAENMGLVSLSSGEKFHYVDSLTNESGETDMLYVDCPNAETLIFSCEPILFNNKFKVYGHSAQGIIDHNYECTLCNTSHAVCDSTRYYDNEIAKIVVSCGKTINITYDYNEGTRLGQATEVYTAVAGTPLTLFNYGLYRENYVFKGYSTQKSGGNLVTYYESLPDESFTVYAQWALIDDNTSITINANAGENFNVSVFHLEENWELVDSKKDVNSYFWKVPLDLPKLNINTFYSTTDQVVDLIPDINNYSPICICANFIDSHNDFFYRIVIYTNSSEGSFIKNYTYNNIEIKPYASAVINDVLGNNDFYLNIISKEDNNFLFKSPKNLVVKYQDMLNQDDAQLQSLIKFNLKKQDCLLFIYGQYYIPGTNFLSAPIYNGMVSVILYRFNDVLNKYDSQEVYYIMGYVKDCLDVSVRNQINGFEYAGATYNLKTYSAEMFDGENCIANLLVEGGGETVSSKFNANGGKFSDASDIKEIDQITGQQILLPNEDPSIDGKIFEGWYTASEGGDPIDVNAYPWNPLDKAIPWDPAAEGGEANVYYAHWSTTPPGPVPPDPPGPDPDPEPIPVVDPVEDIGSIDLMYEIPKTSDNNGLVVFGLLFCILGSAVILRKSYIAK